VQQRPSFRAEVLLCVFVSFIVHPSAFRCSHKFHLSGCNSVFVSWFLLLLLSFYSRIRRSR
jgi:hypothetical protein